MFPVYAAKGIVQIMDHSKIKKDSELAKILVEARSSGKSIGFTNGCFDILHVGHVRYLAAARRECDKLVVGVNSDASVSRLKGKERPVNGEFSRLEVLAALECVDYVVLFSEDTPEDLIKKLRPDILFKGGDWEEDAIVGGDFVKSNGGKVRVIPFVNGYSTTNTIEKMRKTQSS